MTGIRQSFLISLEAGDEFSKGKCPTYKWVAPPPGSYFNSTHNRQTSRIQSAGSKYWDTVAYGNLTGQWDWTFTLDYKYLTPLLMVFDKYETHKVNANRVDVNGDSYWGYRYTFSKENNGRVPSFTVRRKILNYMAGGPVYSDEMVELRGCVCKNFRFTKSEGSSQVNVTMTGFYTDEKMITGELPNTDYQEYSGKLVEWMCMFISDDGSSYDYVANTDNLGLSVENNAGAVYNVCSPFAKSYFEGLSDFSFTTSCYSNNPDKYKKRLYFGGDKGWTGSTSNPTDQPLTVMPAAKGLKPLSHIKLVSYSGSCRNSTNAGCSNPFGFDNIPSSDERMDITIDDCVIKSLTWPKGNGGMIQDTISSAECKRVSVTVYIKGAYIEFRPSEADVIHSVDTTMSAYADPVNDIERSSRGCPQPPQEELEPTSEPGNT